MSTKSRPAHTTRAGLLFGLVLFLIGLGIGVGSGELEADDRGYVSAALALGAGAGEDASGEPAVAPVSGDPGGAVPGRVFVVSDSTAANYGSRFYPQAGWGQLLHLFLDPDHLTVINRARGGRSSKSYIAEGLWDGVKSELSPGDYLLIQWGHNDRDWRRAERYTTTVEYQGYLRRYVNESRARGGVPVLITPMVMNAWHGSTMRNAFTEPDNDYAGSMKRVAEELDVPLIDLNRKSHELFGALDETTTGRFFYHTYVAGEYPNYPDGLTDGAHFQEMGALMMAKFVTDGFREIHADPRVAALAESLRPQYPVTVRANPPLAGRISLGAELPAGATFTLKALPGSGHRFVRWEDERGESFATESLKTFVVGPRSYQFTACFEDGLPPDPAETASAAAYRDEPR